MTRLYYNDGVHVKVFKELKVGDMFSHCGMIYMKVPSKRLFNAVNIMPRQDKDVYKKVSLKENVIRVEKVGVYQNPGAWQQYSERLEKPSVKE